MKKSISLLLLSLLMITPSCQKPKEVTNEYNIVPQPNQLVPKEGRFELSNKVRLVVPSDAPEVKKVADGFAEQLKQTAGISLKEAESVDGKPAISFVLQEGMPKEGYKLSVTPTLITVTASQPNGFFYGVQTIYQLLPPAVYGKELKKKADELGVKEGVLIAEVVEGGSAAGVLKSDDVIVGIDGKKVHKFTDLQEVLAKHRPGDKVKVKVIRDKKEKEFVLTLKNSQGNTKVVKDAGMELLGAAFKPVSSELKRQLNLGYGLEVTGVSNGKMADAGIRKGFIILKANNVQMKSVEDLEQVVEIEKALFSDPWTKEGFFTFLTKENTMFFVVEEKEKILAYCSMQTVLDEGDILNVAVRSDRQKEGIGYFLVDSMLKMAEMSGIHIVHLEVREGNGTARRLYERLGFKEDGLRRDYYTDPTENAVLMTKMQ